MNDRTYEIMFIVRPDVEEADLDKLIEGFHKNVTDGGGEIRSTEKMGRRRLAYTVRKFNDGFYVLLTIAAEGKLISEDRTPPPRLRAGHQVHHRAHGRRRESVSPRSRLTATPTSSAAPSSSSPCIRSHPRPRPPAPTCPPPPKQPRTPPLRPPKRPPAASGPCARSDTG